MEDLEILCGSCHGAHHRAEKAAKGRKRKSRKTLHRKGLLSYLTNAMRKALMTQFNLKWYELDYEILAGDRQPILRAACEKLGVDDYYPRKAKIKSKRSRRGRHPNLSPKPSITY